MPTTSNEINRFLLTQYSHGAGCGCKLSPQVLDEILKTSGIRVGFPGLLIGSEHMDDAAVMDLGDGTAIVSTTDFFMPIVDDAEDFGRIASVNAISDIYAMGATPLLAIAILGWPVQKLPPEEARRVLEGARKACAEANIPLAGGHSIDTLEPIFGLAVTGRVDIQNIKKNGGAKPGASLFLTKPLGVGVLTTAQKKGKLKEEDQDVARMSMVQLNKFGAIAGKLDYVEAMTDVTGFGLLGHISEMCEASDASAILYFEAVPQLDKSALKEYIEAGCIPGGTLRNWESYGHKINGATDYQQKILSDPQTSGGLLIAVAEGKEAEFMEILKKENLTPWMIGKITVKNTGDPLIKVI